MSFLVGFASILLLHQALLSASLLLVADIGPCRQGDYLWPMLPAKTHLLSRTVCCTAGSGECQSWISLAKMAGTCGYGIAFQNIFWWHQAALVGGIG